MREEFDANKSTTLKAIESLQSEMRGGTSASVVPNEKTSPRKEPTTANDDDLKKKIDETNASVAKMKENI